jgi:predicted nucleic-acid-binding protein
VKALDTNVLVRFSLDVADDAQAANQWPLAVVALPARSFLLVTVLLELEWVMRAVGLKHSA